MAAIITTAGIVLPLLYFINGENLPSTVVFSPSELIQDRNNSFKFALRYGFQRTSECKDFSKAFICVQKCLDLGFDVAHSNRHCFCTCYYKRGKPKRTSSKTVTKTKWRLGAPTTKLPFWAYSPKRDVMLKQNDTADVQYVLQEGNTSDIIFDVQTENATVGADTLATGAIENSTDSSGTVTQDAGNATSVKEDNSTQTGGTGAPKDAENSTDTGAANVTAAGDANVTAADAANVTDLGAANVTAADAANVTAAGAANETGTGNAAEGTQNPSASDGTNISDVSSNNTGVTEHSQSGTASQPASLQTNQSDAITGGTEKSNGGALTTVST